MTTALSLMMSYFIIMSNTIMLPTYKVEYRLNLFLADNQLIGSIN